MRNIEAKKALVYGKGISGMGAAAALDKCGVPCDVCDDASFDGINVADYDLIVVSPSIPLTHRIFEKAAAAGAEVIGEIELGARLCDKPLIAVTGTNGKTTVTRLIGKALGYSRDTCVTGNVGRSFALDACDDHDIYICETSSFQLETVKTFAPSIAVVTNITEDHLDRHGSFENYARTKMRVAAAQTSEDYLILNVNEIPECALKDFNPSADVLYTSRKSVVRGAYLSDNKFYWFDEPICRVNRMRMMGMHNAENALSMIAVAKLLGVTNSDIVRALEEFEPDEYRITYSGCVRGVAFYNDSKGTNVAASVMAIKAMPSPCALIAGGFDKGFGFDELFETTAEQITVVCAIGQTQKAVVDAARRHGVKAIACATLTEAVTEAYHSGADNVLFSPATSSFDMFGDYRDRGAAFDKIVGEIVKSEKV